MLPRNGFIAALFALALLAPAGAAEPGKTLDDGRLDPAWFGPGVEFRTTDDIDYVWVKPGFSLKGKKLRVEKWPDPAFLGKDRRGRDSARAFELVDNMPMKIRSSLKVTLQGTAEIVPEGGDLILSGRLVDYVSGGTMGKSQPGATWDMKITGAAGGELLVAVHHRTLMVLAKTEERIDIWLEKFGEALKDDLKMAASGTPATS